MRRSDVEAMAKRYGLDMENEVERLKAAEEVLAHLAQTKPQSGFVQRAIAAIRKWLRENVPALANMKLSDGEIIENYLLPARRFVEGTAEKRKGRDWLRNMGAFNSLRSEAKATLGATPVLTGQPSSPVSHVHEQSTHWRDARFAQMVQIVKGEPKPDDIAFSRSAPAANVANPANGLTPFRDRMERIADSPIYNFQKRLLPATEAQDAVLAEEGYSEYR